MIDAIAGSFLLLLSHAQAVESVTETDPSNPRHPSARVRQVSFDWLGYARRISRSWSASRDTPAMNMLLLPRPALMAGGEFALFSLRHPAWSLRVGFGGFVELEVDGTTQRTNAGIIPAGTGNMLWRGSYTYFVAFAPDAVGRRMCKGCAFEFTLDYRHESQHYTASNHGDGDTEDVSAQPLVGDSLSLDVALAQAVGTWHFAERAIGTAYVPEHSSYSGSAGIDLHARWARWKLIQPFTSLYGEYRVGDDLAGREYPDAYRARALLGIALPSKLGDIMVYGSGDVGHRYGVRILTEEATLGLGIRLALHAHPNGG